jgi:hypothetical protein
MGDFTTIAGLVSSLMTIDVYLRSHFESMYKESISPFQTITGSVGLSAPNWLDRFRSGLPIPRADLTVQASSMQLF